MDINPDTEAAVRVRHPWLTFHVDLGNMAPKFWMLLGEARSKADHLSMVPVPKAYAETLHRVELAKGVHATTAIEGNTLTASQVLERMEGQLHVEPSQEYQVREVDNVLAAYNGILADILAGTPPALSSEAICQFNRTILEGLPREDHVTPGEIRTDPVTVGGGIYTPPNAAHCRYLLDRLCDWLNGPAFEQRGDMRIPVALIKASLAHLYLAWIHPFGDGNGRTARCIEFLVLITSGVPTSAAHLISNHCNQTRSEYYRELRVASASGGDVSSFLSYCLQGFVGGMTEQLKMVYGHQFELAWSEVVRQRVDGRDLEMVTRRRRLAETMLRANTPIAKSELASLNAELARAYARRGAKTLTRDVNELVNLGLLVQDEDGRVRARREELFSLLPLAIPEGGARELELAFVDQPQISPDQLSLPLV